ncbi:MAG TPA: cytochrome c [Gemmatimonadales bacterium]|nr:cytochrome c [Gemmatimonadales bacterium]
MGRALLVLMVVVAAVGVWFLARQPPAGNASAVELPERFAFGQAATPEQVAAWDIDVKPNGEGLPPGSGTVADGARVYARKCAACHGVTGTEGPYDVLVGREPRDSFPFGREPRLTSTIGNYWPYATTLYDYLNRAMPLMEPGSLTPNEVYGLVAWLLWRNEITSEDAVMNATTLPAVVMPARERFVEDNRRGGGEVR